MTAGAPEYEILAAELTDAGVVPSLSEVHGGLCGVMCVGGIAAADRWLEQCLGDWQLQRGDEVGEMLREVECDAWRKLNEADLSFEPLVPDDEEPLEAQVRGLALWCHGFLTGLAFGGLHEAGENSESTGGLAEITKDFADISRAGVSEEDAEDADQSGFALAELKEYVRVGAQVLFEQFAAQRPEAGTDLIH